jgi:uncharacterized damage-inducible protein DinB
MSGEAAQFAFVFERIGEDVLAALAGVSDEALNRRIDLPETNTLFALATHLAGAGEFWALALAAGRTVQRDHAEEFRASGSLTHLNARYRRWIADIHDALDSMPDESLDKVLNGPPDAYRGSQPPGKMTARECLLHALEHSALHLGQIQMTRQLLGLPAVEPQ